jgi:putative redox protein
MGIVIVRGAASGFAQDVVVEQRHHLKADEPEAAGGTDSGPTPYDYLLVALGA